MYVSSCHFIIFHTYLCSRSVSTRRHMHCANSLASRVIARLVSVSSHSHSHSRSHRFTMHPSCLVTTSASRSSDSECTVHTYPSDPPCRCGGLALDCPILPAIVLRATRTSPSPRRLHFTSLHAATESPHGNASRRVASRRVASFFLSIYSYCTLNLNYLHTGQVRVPTRTRRVSVHYSTCRKTPLFNRL